MNIRAVTFDRLTSRELAAWSDIQRGNPLLASPYFRPEFVQAVATVRRNVEVAVLKQGGDPVGFFPYERTLCNGGRPVAGTLSDFQAVIAPANLVVDPRELLRSCRLWTWNFDHLVATQSSFAPHMLRHDESPFIVLGDENSPDAEARFRLAVGHGQKRRKLEREVGQLRFVPHVADRALLAKLFDWKGAQFRRAGLRDIFEFEWARDLLEKILQHNGKHFAAMMSVLYAGDVVAAIHFGMRSGDALHAWFPTYNPQLAKYSPGMLHFLELIQTGHSLGLRRIDLGKGPEPFKRRLMTGTLRVAEGAVDLRPGGQLVRRLWRIARERIHSSRLYTPARVPARMIYKLQSRLELQ